MLRVPASPPQLQAHQTPDPVIASQPTHTRDGPKQGAILKATAKVLAFLSRRSQSLQSEQGDPQQAAEIKAPQLQSNSAARRSERHGEMRAPASFSKGHSSIRQYLSQHRTSTQQQESKLESWTSLKTQRKKPSSSSSSSSASCSVAVVGSAAPLVQEPIVSSPSLSTLNPANTTPQQCNSNDSATKRQNKVNREDKLKAREQLRLVRHLLKSQAKRSAFFRQYAPLVDDWRNFLPGGPAADAASHVLMVDGQTAQLGKVAREASIALLRNTASHHERRSITESPSNSNNEDLQDAMDHSSEKEISSQINKKAATSQTVLASASGIETSLEKLGSCGHNQDQPHLLSSPRQQQQHYLASCRSASLSMSSQSILQELMRERELCRLASASSLSSMSSSGLRRDTSFLSANDADGEDETGLSHVTSPISPTSTMPSLMAALTDREPEGTQFATVMTTTPPPLVLESMATSPVDQSNDGDDEYDGHSPSVGKGAQSKYSHSSRAAATRHRGTRYRHQGEHAFSSVSSTRSRRRSSDHDYFQEAVVTSVLTQLPRSEFILGSEDDSDYNTDDSQDLLLPKSTTEDSLSESHVEQTAGMRITTTTSTTTTSRCVEERNGQRLRATSPDSILSNTGSTSDTSTLIDSDIHLPAMVQQQQQQPLNNGNSEEQRQALVATSIITAGPVEIAAPTAVRPSLTLQTLNHSQQRHATESVGAAAISEGPSTASDSCPRSARPSLTKCNSTSSLYIDSTMTKNDVDETLRAVASVLYSKVLESHKQNDCRTEPIINSTSYIHTDRVMMTEADIFDFMRFIFDCGQNLGAENAIITLVYLERALDRGNLSFHAINWRRLLLGALILSIKVWEDMAVFNADVCSIFDGLHVQDVNALERFMMARMEYNMSVKRSVYAAAYFRLRDVSETHSNRIYLQLAKESLSLSSSTTLSSPVDGLNSVAGASPFPWPTMAGGVSLSRKVGATVAATVTSACATIAGGSVPIGPGYRKWTLKPLTVREADRLEARSELFSCKLMMEEQDLKDMGCCLDEYASRMRLATPEDLYHSMHTLASTIGSSSTTTNSVSGSMPSNTVSGKNTTASDSGSSLVSSSTAQTLHSSTTMSSLHSTTPSNVTASTQLPTKNGLATCADASTLIASMPPRTLRMKKSRSDFFYQNTTPAAIM